MDYDDEGFFWVSQQQQNQEDECVPKEFNSYKRALAAAKRLDAQQPTSFVYVHEQGAYRIGRKAYNEICLVWWNKTVAEDIEEKPRDRGMAFHMPNRGKPRFIDYEPSAPDDDEEEAQATDGEPGSEQTDDGDGGELKYRVIDWKRLVLEPVAIPTIVIIVIIGLHFLKLPEPVLNSMVITVVLVGLVALPANIWVNLLGVHLDQAANTLSYPVYLLRLKIPLAAIRAANCETVTKRKRVDNSMARVMDTGIRYRQRTIFKKRFWVNLSGDFESRRIRFYSQYKRDQFLTYLRDCVPGCRITRWT